MTWTWRQRRRPNGIHQAASQIDFRARPLARVVEPILRPLASINRWNACHRPRNDRPQAPSALLGLRERNIVHDQRRAAGAPADRQPAALSQTSGRSGRTNRKCVVGVNFLTCKFFSPARARPPAGCSCRGRPASARARWMKISISTGPPSGGGGGAPGALGPHLGACLRAGGPNG